MTDDTTNCPKCGAVPCEDYGWVCGTVPADEGEGVVQSLECRIDVLEQQLAKAQIVFTWSSLRPEYGVVACLRRDEGGLQAIDHPGLLLAANPHWPTREQAEANREAAEAAKGGG